MVCFKRFYVVVPKKNSEESRITVDLTGLNKFVKRPVHPTRVPREAVAAIPSGMKVFTTLDSRHGYWQIQSDESEFETQYVLDPMGGIPFSLKCYGSIVSW